MIVRLLGGPLAGCGLSTTPNPWPGGWLTAGAVDWGLYVPVHRNTVTSIVLAEVRVTVLRRPYILWAARPGPAGAARAMHPVAHPVRPVTLKARG
ncbi:hypothetical protein AB0N14_32865 [Streptomyces sp. NPDC051104]|uniref:hypothetical protein n=1 Tax=Streptomyces sp. NPDC051104 TaxID=3155044 RepID=UPI0034143451